MTIEKAYRNFRNSLIPKYGEGEAEAMARIVFQHLKNWDYAHLLANGDREASAYLVNKCDEILNKLLQDIPLQYILGETVFYGLRIKTAPEVLIPRPETEQLVDIIVNENQRPDLHVMDFCTGSGAIAVALARNLPFSVVEAIDISPAAIALAKENASSLKANVKLENIDVFHFTPLASIFDIIVSNPPYVTEAEKKEMEPNVLKYEPHIALFVSDEDPLLFYRRIAEIGKVALKEGGRMYFEINPLFCARLENLLHTLGYGNIEIIKDIHGRARFAKCMKPE